MPHRRGVVVLGATGSIGQSTCRILRRHADRFRVTGISADRKSDELDMLAAEFEPDFAILSGCRSDDHAPHWNGAWLYGAEALVEAARHEQADIVVNALVGVAGGALVVEAWRHGGGEILPVDSEHSAVHQCLAGRPSEEVSRLILTASGGPFRDLPTSEFDSIRWADALAHPTWDMGSKISVDSATLANKALEVIEAHLLFDIALEDIEVVVHPTSIVHSLVEFRDGSTMAQLGFPTMEVPILYALSAPDRLDNEFRPFDPISAGPLEFEAVRRSAFPMFELGLEAARLGGTAPAAYNAANEVAVDAFLADAIGFPEISTTVESVVTGWSGGPADSLASVLAADSEARRLAAEALGNRQPPQGC